MNFNEAIEKYNSNSTNENLYAVAKELCKELKLSEKLHMLSGQDSEDAMNNKIEIKL